MATAIKTANGAGVSSGFLDLPPLVLKEVVLHIVGDTPLVCHRWDEKAKQMILDKQMKKAAPPRVAKDPEKAFRDSLYPMPDGDGYGFRAIAFKLAAVDACTQIAGVTKVFARGAFHVLGIGPDQLVKIESAPPVMREDMVRIGIETADIRYRGEFTTWKAYPVVRYNANVLSIPQLVDLFRTGGFAVGVGEWRPQCNGNMGMFHVESVDILPDPL